MNPAQNINAQLGPCANSKHLTFGRNGAEWGQRGEVGGQALWMLHRQIMMLRARFGSLFYVQYRRRSLTLGELKVPIDRVERTNQLFTEAQGD